MMKKLLVLITVLFLGLSISSCKCSGNHNKDKESEIKEFVVENVISTDREYMSLTYDTNYVWFETQIYLNDYLDEECDGSIEKITNVFQVVTTTDSVSFNTLVVKIDHVGGLSSIEEIDGFWVEDMKLNDEIISISYKDAFKFINETNYTKPHSKNCVLRKEVGPVEANAQYIFGNLESQLYVDALTGDVSDESPSFCDNE